MLLANGLLEETRIHAKLTRQNNYLLSWCYSDFLALDGKLFPVNMSVSLQGMVKTMKASFVFSRCETQMEYAPLTIPNRYKQVEVSDILKNLLKE